MSFTQFQPNTDYNGAPGNTSLLRDEFTGKVLTAIRKPKDSDEFIATHVLAPGQSSLTIYANGKTKAKYLANDLSAMAQSTLNLGKFNIKPDQQVYVDTVLTNVDLFETPLRDLGTRIAAEQSEALVEHSDIIGFLALAKAAETSAILPDLPGGLSLDVLNCKTDVPTFIAAVKSFISNRAKEGISVQKRGDKIVVGPDLYMALSSDLTLASRDYGSVAGLVEGRLERLLGLGVTMAVNLPSEDLSNNTAITAAGLDPALILAKYRGDYSDLAALILTPKKGDMAAVAKVVESTPRTIAGQDLLQLGHGVSGIRWMSIEHYGMEVLDPSYACSIYDRAP